MGFTVRMDFEGDQWTFFKPPPEDLEAPVRRRHPRDAALPAAAAADRGADRSRPDDDRRARLLVPAGHGGRRATGREHVKTSVVAEAIDPAGERLRYFHNTSLHELEGEDYRGVFRLGREFSDDVLPPYTELVRFDAGPRLQGEELRDRRASRCCATTSRRARRRIRSSASAARLAERPARSCSRAMPPTTTTTRSPRCGCSAPRSRSPPRTSTGCSATEAADGERGADADRRGLQGALASSSRGASPFDPRAR